MVGKPISVHGRWTVWERASYSVRQNQGLEYNFQSLDPSEPFLPVIPDFLMAPQPSK